MYAPLVACSALDGRYASKTAALSEIFSEFGLIKYRYQVELLWFKALAKQPGIKEIKPLSTSETQFIDQLIHNFSIEKAGSIKKIEQKINHDVKAVEYQLKHDFATHPTLKDKTEFLHFACTSEDINNLAYALMLNDGRNYLLSQYRQLYAQIFATAQAEKSTAMLARTHGQPASPTTLGKEIANTAYRLARQIKQLDKQEILGKINGAVGNFNAHYIAYPTVDWCAVSQEFVQSLSLVWNPLTTQIEPHDYIAELLHILCRANVILIDFCRDIWTYISLGYFHQKVIANEIGSSTMPHKINPIDFENAEGNFGLANALAEHLAHKLPISRLQRDLTDSTVLRNLGSVFGYILIALVSLKKGIDKLESHPSTIANDLAQQPAVLAEAIQTVMRQYGITNAYEQLKALTRGQPITTKILMTFIETLTIPDAAKKQLCALTPADYIGLATQLVDDFVPKDP